MNIKQVLAELDNLYENSKIAEIDSFLQNSLLEAKKERDTSSMITLVNEIIGFYRDINKYEEAIAYCEQIVTLMKQCGYEGTVPYATTLLNVANAYRAVGDWKESEDCYKEVETIYGKNLSKTDYRYASLYNNRSLLYQEQGKFEEAKESLERALSIISQYNNTQIEIATTHTNLATTMLRLGDVNEALEHLILALSIFEEDGGKDFHYSAALSAMGDAKYLSDDLLAAESYYQKALVELESHVGRTEAYERIADNLKIVQDKISSENIQRETTEEKMVGNESAEQDVAINEAYEEENEESEEVKEEEEDDFDIEDEDDFERNDYEVEKSEEEAKTEVPGNPVQIISEDDFEEDCEEDSEEEKDVTFEISKSDEVFSQLNEELQLETNAKEQEKEFVNRAPIGLELCEAFYHEFGEAMIHNKFPEYEDRIAVGLAGEGSECLGFDDSLSEDHDFGPGFAMWLDDETYEEIGERLEAEYNALPKEFRGYTRYTTEEGMSRVGVSTISDFYNRIIGLKNEPQSELEWYNIKTGALAAATSGKVFRDDLGAFSAIRKKLKELFPEKVHICKIAEEMAYLSQFGQYNYPRTMIRQDYVTSKIIVAEFMTHAMKMVYLLNRTYEPYYKWQRRGLKDLVILPEIGDILDAIADMPDQREAWKGFKKLDESKIINENDQIQMSMEVVVRLILEELKMQGYVTSDDSYLDHNTYELVAIIQDPLKLAKTRKVSRERVMAVKHSMEQSNNQPENNETETQEETKVSERIQEAKYRQNESLIDGLEKGLNSLIKPELPQLIQPEKNDDLVEKIVMMEWKQFDKVQNEGGRADCQDDWQTFSIMRKSQYYTWPRDLLKSFYHDLAEAEAAGWNLITEKYARMMESTVPARYAVIKDTLPVMSDEKKNVCEQIIRIQVGWMETFAQDYPNMAGQARSIHTYEDNEYNTSYETYLRGELGTYSDDTLALYGRMVVNLARDGKNLAKMIMTNTAVLYGYATLEEAESVLSN